MTETIEWHEPPKLPKPFWSVLLKLDDDSVHEGYLATENPVHWVCVHPFAHHSNLEVLAWAVMPKGSELK